MDRMHFAAIVALLLIALGSACMRPAADPYAHHLGEAYWANRNASIANPNAGHGDPIVGLDGTTTEGVMETYRNSQKEQLPVYTDGGLVEDEGN